MKVGLGHIDSSWGKSQSAALCDNSPRTSFRGKICSQVEPQFPLSSLSNNGIRLENKGNSESNWELDTKTDVYKNVTLVFASCSVKEDCHWS